MGGVTLGGGGELCEKAFFRLLHPAACVMLNTYLGNPKLSIKNLDVL